MYSENPFADHFLCDIYSSVRVQLYLFSVAQFNWEVLHIDFFSNVCCSYLPLYRELMILDKVQHMGFL